MEKVSEEYIDQLVKESVAQLPKRIVERLKEQAGHILTSQQILQINSQINRMPMANFMGYLMYGIIKEENLDLFSQMSNERQSIARAFFHKDKSEGIPKPLPPTPASAPSVPNLENKKGAWRIYVAVIAILSILLGLYLKNERDKRAYRDSILQALDDKMVTISGGTFVMGAAEGDSINDDEKPSHLVAISTFHISKYEVTQEEWEVVMGHNPSKYVGDNFPVGNVSWNDCQVFVEKLNQMTGRSYRLPTEAEWEYAARGGENSAGYKYAGSDNLFIVGWSMDNSYQTMHAVGQKQPNELGLYDMTGNVYEYCADEWYYYSDSPQTNPTHCGNSNSKRVIRGGSCDNSSENSRVTSRRSVHPKDVYPAFGLRLAY